MCVQIGHSDVRIFHVIKHSPEAIETCLKELRKENKGNIAVAVELTKGPIVYALQKYSFVTVFPIHSLTLARYRQAMFSIGAKDNPSDAALALDMMLNYPHKVKPLRASSDNSRTLALLVEQRGLLVEDKCRNTNRLIDALKQYYPQQLEWFGHRDTELFCDFLIKWPTLDIIKRAREMTIVNFFNGRGGKARLNTEKRVKAIKEAIALAVDNSLIFLYKILVTALCKQMLTLIENIRIYDKKIKLLFHTMPDSILFESLPGTGPCLAPKLLAALSEDRE